MPASTDAWTLTAAAFPADGSDEQQLRFFTRYAVLAPSNHNTQPWRFEIGRSALALRADARRRLPVMDPDDRELLMSCGAALFSLRTAARSFGRLPEVERLPDPDVPDLLARVRLGGDGGASPEAVALREAILRRRTNRRPFADRPLPVGLPGALCRAAEAEGARLHLYTDPADKAALADLIAEGDHRQFDDAAFRAELAAWIRSPSTGDGIAPHHQGVPKALDAAAPAVAAVVRRFDRGDGTAAKDHQLAQGAPTLAVLTTEDDTREAWLRAGEALGHVLLRAQVEGVQASYLNQPIEVAALRPRLRTALGLDGHPQILVRIGRGPQLDPSPRRPAEEVIEEAPAL